MKPIKLSELIDCLEFDSEEHVNKLDLENGCVVSVDSSVLYAAETEDEESLEDLPEWQQAERELAQAIVNDASGRFISAPGKFEFDEYRHMERFIQSLREVAIAEQLWRAIKGKGAFRHFKNTAQRLGLLDQWFEYRDKAVKEYVLHWAEENQVQVVDDTKARSKR